MGGENWVNNSYVSNAVKYYFTSSKKTLAGLVSRNLLTHYVLGGIYLFSPTAFFKITKAYPEAMYFALDSLEKWLILLYPFLVVLMLWCAYRCCIIRE